jgi:hypothetical protein
MLTRRQREILAGITHVRREENPPYHPIFKVVYPAGNKPLYKPSIRVGPDLRKLMAAGLVVELAPSIFRRTAAGDEVLT